MMNSQKAVVVALEFLNPRFSNHSERLIGMSDVFDENFVMDIVPELPITGDRITLPYLWKFAKQLDEFCLAFHCEGQRNPWVAKKLWEIYYHPLAKQVVPFVPRLRVNRKA